jgi:hypothetical protein
MKECLPKDLDTKQLAELQNLTKAYNAADASVWGTCEGACYVRQVGASLVAIVCTKVKAWLEAIAESSQGKHWLAATAKPKVTVATRAGLHIPIQNFVHC